MVFFCHDRSQNSLLKERYNSSSAEGQGARIEFKVGAPNSVFEPSLARMYTANSFQNTNPRQSEISYHLF
jgi:hypothetical protein